MEPEQGQLTNENRRGERSAARESRRRRLRKRLRASFGLRVTNGVLLTLGALLTAIGFNLFLVPGDVAPGGITGLTLVVTRFLPVPNGILLLILNVPLLYLGYRVLGGVGFLLRTVYVVVLMGIAIDITSLLLPVQGISDDLLLNALYGGALLGIANALIIRAYGNMGGTGILARVIQRRTGAPLGQIYLVTDGFIVALLGLAFGWENALYSMVALIVTGIVTDYAVEGPSIVRTVFIITDRPREVAEALQLQLNTGVTSWHGQGMYRGGERTVLFCTVNRAEVRELRRVANEVDPEGFMVIGQGQSASGGTIGRSNAPG